MVTKNIHEWFAEYGISHQHPINKLIHWICVPSIFFSIVCLLSLVPVASVLNLAMVMLLFAALFYMRLSPKLTIGMVAFYLICLWGARQLSLLSFDLWKTALTIFVLAWIGQFIGHQIEGQKPSFLKDLQFLLIGPAWLMSFVYRRLGISY